MIIGGNVAGMTGAAINIQPTGTGTATVVLNRIQVENNLNGIKVDGTGSTNAAGINVTVANSVSAGNEFHGIAAVAPAGAGNQAVDVMVDHAQLVNNIRSGARADGAQAQIRLGNTTITGNTDGTSTVNSGQVLSYGNNRIDANVADGPNPPVIPQK